MTEVILVGAGFCGLSAAKVIAALPTAGLA
jgi:ribulose 1,5-bisphosphate synthetase/thiazole synthase